MLETLSPRPNRFNRVVGGVFLALLSASLFFDGRRDYRNGGEEWRQGDWLINSAAGTVRRAVTGDALIWLADVTGLPLMGLTIGSQLLLGSLFFLMLAIILRRSLWPDRILILVTSPAFAPVFWFTIYTASFRKELLAYLAFLLIPLSAPSQHWRAIATTAACLFVFACFAHEAMIFLAPFFLACLAILYRRHEKMQEFRATAIGILIGVGLALHLAITHSHVEDANAICRRLLEHGVSEHICNGSIKWLSLSTKSSIQNTVASYDGQALVRLVVPFLLSLLPIAVALGHVPRRKLWILVAAICGLFLLPLYVVAIDWGRWLSMQMTAVTLVILTLEAVNRPSCLAQPLPVVGKLALLALNLSWGFHHMNVHIKGGVIFKAGILDNVLSRLASGG